MSSISFLKDIQESIFSFFSKGKPSNFINILPLDVLKLIFSYSPKVNCINLASKQFRELQYSSFFESYEFQNTLTEFEEIKQKYKLSGIPDINVFKQLTISKKIDVFIKIKKILKIEQLFKSSKPLIFKESEGRLRFCIDKDPKECFREDFNIRYVSVETLVFSRKFVRESFFHDIKTIIHQLLQKNCTQNLFIASLEKIKDKQLTYLFPKLIFFAYMNEKACPYLTLAQYLEGAIIKEILQKVDRENISFETAVKEMHSKVLRSLKIKINVTPQSYSLNNGSQSAYLDYIAQHFSISTDTLSLIKAYTEKKLKETYDPLCDDHEPLPYVAKILPEAKDLLENQIVQIMIINHKKIHSTICLELFSPETFDIYVQMYKRETEKMSIHQKEAALSLQSNNFDDFVRNLYQIAYLCENFTIDKFLNDVIAEHKMVFGEKLIIHNK